MASRSASLKKRSDSMACCPADILYQAALLPMSVVGDRRRPVPFPAGLTPLLVQAAGLRGSRGSGLAARNLVPQSLPHQLGEAFHGRVLVGHLAAVALGGD